MADRLSVWDVLLIAEAALGIPTVELARTTSIQRLESALAAPFAGVAEAIFYEDPVERAAICCSRLIRNHPLIEGNEEVGYECMREMLERAGAPWPRPKEDAIEITLMVNALAASSISEQEFVTWVKRRVESGRERG